jgi:hypothetical protein
MTGERAAVPTTIKKRSIAVSTARPTSSSATTARWN